MNERNVKNSEYDNHERLISPSQIAINEIMCGLLTRNHDYSSDDGTYSHNKMNKILAILLDDNF